MIAKCPKCGRPNTPEAPRCIYCGASLPAAPAAKAETEKPAEPKAPAKKIPQRLFLILSPRDREPPEALVKGFAELMQWDFFSARLRLKNPSPAILRIFENAEAAREFSRSAADLGLDSYLVREAALEAINEKQIALSAEINGGVLNFALEGETHRELPFSELLLLVRGRGRLEGELGQRLGRLQVPEVQAERERLFDRLIERRQLRKAVNLEEGALVPAAATAVELFDLYARDDHRAVRVIESRFDFAPLFGPEFRGRLLGMVKFVELLKASAPALVVNDDFNAVAYTYPGKPHEKKKLPSARKAGRGRAAEKLHSLEALFNEYSGLIYLYYLRRLKQSEAAPE